MTESELLKRLMLALSDVGRVFRNNVGNGWQSSHVLIAPKPMAIDLKPGDVVLRQARRVQYGLAVGSGDLIGWMPHTITAADVGRTVPIFTTVECKSDSGRLTPEQRNFLDAVRRSGGIAVEARDVDATIAQINEQRRGQS